MSVSGETLLEWRRKGLCLDCGIHPAPYKPHVCAGCQIKRKNADKLNKKLKAAGR